MNFRGIKHQFLDVYVALQQKCCEWREEQKKAEQVYGIIIYLFPSYRNKTNVRKQKYRCKYKTFNQFELEN